MQPANMQKSEASIITKMQQKAMENPAKIVSMIVRIIAIVFSVITVICAAVTASRIDVVAIFDALSEYARLGINVPPAINEQLTKNIGVFICSILLLATCIGMVIREILLLLCSVLNHRCSSKLVLIIDGILGGIAILVLFSIAISMAVYAGEYKDGKLLPILKYSESANSRQSVASVIDAFISSIEAAAAFGFLTTFALVGLIISLVVAFYLDKVKAEGSMAN